MFRLLWQSPPAFGRGALLASLAGLAALALTPARASGHAAFLDSQPEAGTRIEAAPGQITLTFTEPLDRNLSEAELVNAETGESVPAAVTEGGERELVLQPEVRLERAPYRVDWHTVSTVDGHALEGSFGFGVQTAAAAGEHAVEQSPLAREGWLRIAARAVFYAALFFFAGGLFTGALLGRRGAPAGWLFPRSLARHAGTLARRREALIARAWRRTIDAGWIAAGAAVAVAVIEAWDASGGLDPRGLGDFLLSNDAGLARAGTALAVLLAVIQASRLPIAASAWLAIAFGAIALGGHANSAAPRFLAVTTDWVHLLAGALWIGGIAQLAAFWLPLARGADRGLRLAAIRSVLPRFGRIALPAFLVVAATGLTNALIELGRPGALWETAYGRVLALKIFLVGLIALASYGHAIRLRPRLVAGNPHARPEVERRHWRLFEAEPLLAVGVIVAVAVLVTFPLPPQQLGETNEASAAAPCDPCPLPRAATDELPLAEQAGPNIAAFWLRSDGDGLAGKMRLLDSNTKPVDADVDLPAGERDSCGTGCWRLRVPDPGRTLTVSVTAEGEQRSVTVPSVWRGSRTRAANRLLRVAQERMRRLSSLRMQEALTSGLGQTVHSEYRFQAPDRMAYRTSAGARVVAIGKTAYRSTEGGQFEKGPFGADGFQLEALLRWTIYGSSVRWLGDDRGMVELALFDPATPVWYRLGIDRRRGLVVDERMIAAGHFMDRRYFAFDRPVQISPPR